MAMTEQKNSKKNCVSTGLHVVSAFLWMGYVHCKNGHLGSGFKTKF